MSTVRVDDRRSKRSQRSSIASQPYDVATRPELVARHLQSQQSQQSAGADDAGVQCREGETLVRPARAYVLSRYAGTERWKACLKLWRGGCHCSIGASRVVAAVGYWTSVQNGRFDDGLRCGVGVCSFVELFSDDCEVGKDVWLEKHSEMVSV